MIKCLFDKQGYPRAVASDDRLMAVAAYLEQDMQSSPHSIALMEDILAKVENGTLDAWEGTGNAFTVQIKSKCVSVQNEFEENLSSTLPLEDFRKALEAWKRLLQMNRPSGPC